MSDATAVALRAIDPAELGRRIKTARIERRMTQSSMAAGVASVAYVSRIESGQRRPDIDVLDGLARNLGVSTRELLSGDAAPLRARIQLDLDYAELELNSGSAQAALDRVRALDAAPEEDLAETATLLEALAVEALGDNPLPLLRRLTDDDGHSVDVWLRAQTALCRVLRERGDLEGAIRAGERALERMAERGLPVSRASIRLSLTVTSAHQRVGDSERAAEINAAALAAAELLQDPQATASAYWSASTAQSMLGNLTAALEYAQKALEWMDADADAAAQAQLLGNLGIFQMRSDPPQLEAALDSLSRSSGLMETTSASVSDRARNTLAVAEVHRMAGRHERALEALDHVATHGEAVGPLVRAEAALVRGQVLRDLHRPGSADAFQEAILIASGMGDDRSLTTFWYEIASTLEASGDSAGAIDAYKRAAISAGAVPFNQMDRTPTNH